MAEQPRHLVGETVGEIRTQPVELQRAFVERRHLRDRPGRGDEQIEFDGQFPVQQPPVGASLQQEVALAQRHVAAPDVAHLQPRRQQLKRRAVQQCEMQQLLGITAETVTLPLLHDEFAQRLDVGIAGEQPVVQCRRGARPVVEVRHRRRKPRSTEQIVGQQQPREVPYRRLAQRCDQFAIGLLAGVDSHTAS